MSKRSLFWGHGSGKLGEAVYYRAGGEQRTRAYTAIVKNPRSAAQALQRTQFNYVVAAYKSVKGVVDNYYLQRKSNQSPFNAFFKDNFPIAGCVANKTMVAAREASLTGALLTKGMEGLDMSLSKVSLDLSGTSAKPLPAWPIFPRTITSEGAAVNKPVYITDGVGIWQALTNEGADTRFGAEFDLFIVIGLRGNESLVHDVYKVHCSAESSDKLHIVWTSSDVLNDNEIGKTVGFFAGGGVYSAGTASTSKDKMTNASYFVPYAPSTSAADGEWEAGIFVSYRSANGMDVTTSRMLTGSGFFQDYVKPFQPDGTEGTRIIAEYTGLQKGL